MRKFIFLFILLAGISSLGVFLGKNFSENESSAFPIIPPTVTPEPTEPSDPKFGIPQRLKIEKIGVDAQVELVGLDAENKMDVPKKDENVAWYKLGYRPGQKGNAVFAGHFDSRTGGPAVFYALSSLSDGDRITITDEEGNTLTYEVTGQETYQFDLFPLEEVFGKSDKRRLNLITCDGIFDQATQNYSLRTVVYSELLET